MSPSSTTNSESPVALPPEGITGVLFGDGDGLIDEAPSRRQQCTRRRDLLLVVTFLLLNAGSGIIDLAWPVAEARPVGEEAVAYEARWRSVRWQDGSLARWINERSRQRSRVRHQWMPVYSLLLMEGLGQVRQDLLLGRRDWLFLRNRALPHPADDEALSGQAQAALASLTRRSRRAGHRLVVVPIPRKSSLAFDTLPEGIDSRPELDAQLAARLARSDLDWVDILPLLHALPETRGETPYYEGDSHLTRSAMVDMAEQIAHHLELWVPPEQRRTSLRNLGPVPPRNDLLHLAGIDSSALSRRLADIEPRLSFAVLDTAGRPVRRKTRASGEAPLALIGSSFSAYGDLSVYLSHFIDQPVVDFAKPGINPLIELQERLYDAPEHPLPEILVVEIPNYLLFDWDRLQGVEGTEVEPRDRPKSKEPIR